MAPGKKFNTTSAIPWIMTGIMGVAAVGFFYEARVARMEERTAALQELVQTLQEKKEESRPVQIISMPMPAQASPAQILTPKPVTEKNENIPSRKLNNKKSNENNETKAAEVAKSSEVTLCTNNEVQTSEKAEDIAPVQSPDKNNNKGITQTYAAASQPPVDDTPQTGTLVEEYTALKGRVLVSQPRQRRIMIDLGREADIETGSRFTLWRNGLYIGEVRVKTVFDAMSACEVTSASGSGIRIGDRVHQVKSEMACGPLAE